MTEGCGASTSGMDATPDSVPVVVVLVPTFGRPDMLKRCLEGIASQTALRDRRYRVQVIVGDNNRDACAVDQVETLSKLFPVPLSAIHVAEAGLCHNRNALSRAALEADADLVVLIDDDEVPEPNWLSALLAAMSTTGADAMIGPVETIFHPATPEWFRRSGIGQTGARTAALKTGAPSPKLASHNTILDAAILREMEPPWFLPELNRLGAEDQAFFWRAKALGSGNVLWCAEARVREEMPLERADRRYFLRRTIQRGASGVIAAKLVRGLHPGAGPKAPWRETLRQAARLLAGLPLLMTSKGRPRLFRQAVFVYGRLLGHVGATDAFYGG